MKKSKEAIRTFIAVELPSDIQETLKKLQDILRGSMPDVRWTKYSNVHLTLKFLGDVEISRITAIGEALRDIGQGFAPFNMSLSGVGAFPNSNKPRIIWVDIKHGADELAVIANRIETSMKRLGFPKEKRPFRPHLTIGRIRRLKHPLVMKEALERSIVGDLGDFNVHRISLIKSQLNPAGSIYTTLFEASLQKTE